MIAPAIVVNTTKYEAIHLNSPEAEERILDWIAPHLKEGEIAKLDTLREMSAWAIRHPSGAVSFVHPADFERDFEPASLESRLVPGPLTDAALAEFVSKPTH